MSTVIEMVGSSSRSTAEGKIEVSRDYAITGANTAEGAVVALRNYLYVSIGDPPKIDDLVLDEISDAEQIQDVYFSTATWRTFARKRQPAIGDIQSGFDLGTESVRVNAAIGGITVYRSSDATAWNPEKINDKGDGSDVEGVDIFEPIYSENETRWIEFGGLTKDYRNILTNTTGKVNDAQWKGFEKGEVLFMGVSGGQRGAYDTELRYQWSVRKNQVGLSLGDVTDISKEGWQYLWPRYGTVKYRVSENDPYTIIKKITHVAVATVFEYADFSLLNIGT